MFAKNFTAFNIYNEMLLRVILLMINPLMAKGRPLSPQLGFECTLYYQDFFLSTLPLIWEVFRYIDWCLWKGPLARLPAQLHQTLRHQLQCS